MTTLEVIHLRFSGLAPAGLAAQIRASLRNEHGVGMIAVFRRLDLDSDFAVHITHPDGTEAVPSTLAERLATELRAHGLVEHTVWTSLDPEEVES